MIKILHTADLHLDSPFSLKSFDAAQARRRMLRGTFTSVTYFARSENIDIVLMSGDIFDTGFATQDTLKLLKSEFEKAPSVRFVIAPGNHDPYTENSPWAKTSFSDNVYIFKSPVVTKFSFADINTDVYGWAFTSEKCEVCPISSKPSLDASKINILCAHADMSGTTPARYCPLTSADIASSGFDYVALGHIHAASNEVHRAGKTYYAYSGCLEGRSFDECGLKTALLGEFSKENGHFSAQFSPRAFTLRRFEIADIDITGAPDASAVVAAVDTAIREKRMGGDVSLRAVLKGSVPSSLIISEESLRANIGGVGYLEIIDRTTPEYDLSDLENDPGIRGAFYRLIKPGLTDGTEEERACAAKALKYGLEALDGKKN